MHPFTGQNASDREKHVPSGGPDGCIPAPLQHLLEDTPSAEEKQHHAEALHEVLHALQNAGSTESELVKRELRRFGICVRDNDVQYSQISSRITQMVQKEKKSLEFLHSKKGTGASISHSCGQTVSGIVRI